MSKWKFVWNRHSADSNIIENGTDKEIFLELKRAIGNDVIGGGIIYDGLIDEYVKLKARLCKKSCKLTSVYEVGCGSGANLWLFEKDGIKTGGIDYSQSLIDNALEVCNSSDILCDEAINIPVLPLYDAVFSMRVFSYFDNTRYAEEVLNNMCQKAKFAVGLIDIHDAEKEDEFLKFRRKNIDNYDEKYAGLEKLFYKREFFTKIAQQNNMEIEFCCQDTKGYWNNEYGYNVFLYHK